MKEVTRYISNDNTVFSDKQECLNHDQLDEKIKLIMAKLKPIPDGCDFSNGSGYVQQDIKTFNIVKYDLLNEFSKVIDHKWIRQTQEDDSIHPSYVGRIVSGYNIKPFWRAWNRIQCIDEKGREFGQPYYRENPEKCNLIELEA